MCFMNRINTQFIYYNNVESSDKNCQIVDLKYKDNEPVIITIFQIDDEVSIWLPTVNYFGDNTEKTFFINIEEDKKSESSGEEIAKQNKKVMKDNLERYFKNLQILR